MSATVRIVALLPLKAHSQRIPGKNFRPLAGKPLFRWTLDCLLSIQEISKVVINTDARAILAHDGLRENARLVIRDRRTELCGDSVSMNLILADDIEAYPADVYVMTHTTNPLLKPETVRRALSAFMNAKEQGVADSLFSVNRVQTRFYRVDGSAVNHDPKNLIRTQDLEPWFEESSTLYVFTTESFGTTDARIGKTPIMFEIPKIESVDIDDASDWQIAEALANHLYVNPHEPLGRMQARKGN